MAWASPASTSWWMRDRRTETIENSAVTKKALIAINSNTDNNRSKMSDRVSEGEALTAKTFNKSATIIKEGIGSHLAFYGNARQLQPQLLFRIIGQRQ